MKLTKLSTSVCLSLLASSAVLAEGSKPSAESIANPASAAPKSSGKRAAKARGNAKKSTAQLTFFEGCGRKDKDGNWAEFYANCDTEENGVEVPAPPCRSGWVKVKEAVPINLISNLQRCIVEL